MENRSQQHDVKRTRLTDGLDRVAREINAVLLVLAIGLAALDVTGFVAVTVRDAAPSLARGSVDPSDAARRAGALGPSVAVLVPTKPGAHITGR
jgi:hypothetical protein